MIKLLLVSILATCTLLTYSQQKKAKPPIGIIPNASMYNVDGDTANLKDLSANKITFISFWFVPCAPCFQEMNLLHKLYAKYKDNPNVNFLTVSSTDSAFVRPLIENRNTSTNYTYDYFKTLALKDSFRLPVYFLKHGVTSGKSFIKFIFKVAPAPADSKNEFLPGSVFQFSRYPTICIYDNNGKLIYNKTGFTKSGEKQQLLKITSVINAAVKLIN